MRWFRGTIVKPLTFIAIITFIVAVSVSFPGHGYATGIGINETQAKVYGTVEGSSRHIDAQIISVKLKKLGLSDLEIDTRIGLLNDEELHYFASQSDHIYPGAGIGSVIVFTVIVLAAAYAYIKFTGKRVVIE
jgi:hypothetical protein